ncbi:MAG TPA: hypothetical protein VML50_06475 [Anaeromyxobacter sp.]|nr:hypothetical protein [Anaeromyxobacter sp.]
MIAPLLAALLLAGDAPPKKPGPPAGERAPPPATAPRKPDADPPGKTGPGGDDEVVRNLELLERLELLEHLDLFDTAGEREKAPGKDAPPLGPAP